MKRKIFATLTALVMMFSMTAGVTAFAAEEVVSNDIQSVQSVSNPRNEAIVQVLVTVANSVIERMVEAAQNNPNADIDKLIADTNRISATVISIADRLGITVLCEYKEYVINGEVVLIDPLRIINR